MPDPMRIRAQAQGSGAVVRVLMSHEMETGQRKDASGKVIPAWFIQEVSATHNGKPVMSAQWGPAVSKNPFLQFSFKGGKAGDKVAVNPSHACGQCDYCLGGRFNLCRKMFFLGSASSSAVRLSCARGSVVPRLSVRAGSAGR